MEMNRWSIFKKKKINKLQKHNEQIIFAHYEQNEQILRCGTEINLSAPSKKIKEKTLQTVIFLSCHNFPGNLSVLIRSVKISVWHRNITLKPEAKSYWAEIVLKITKGKSKCFGHIDSKFNGKLAYNKVFKL